MEEELLKRAESGDAEAQYELAHKYYIDYYYDDIDEEDSREQAFYWFEKAARSGHVEAMYWTAHCIQCGVGVRFANTDAALPYALKAARAGHVKAMEMLYEMYSHGMSCKNWDFEQALYWLKMAAESGSVEAVVKLGKLYIEGFPFGDSKKFKFEPDPVEGVKWLKKAAENGNLNAFEALGDCYFNGTGVEKDVNTAIEWYEKSAVNGDCNTNYKLGEIYFRGEYVERDYKRAVKYYSAVGWYSPSLKRMGDCYLNGWGVERDFKRAQSFYDRAVMHDDLGFHGVLGEVALVYARDERLHDEKKAIRLLHIACNTDENPECFYERAKRHLVGVDFRDEECQFENRVIRKDFEEAAYYFKKSAELGYAPAQYEYGKCLINGTGVKVDVEAGEKWLKRAAENGYNEEKS